MSKTLLTLLDLVRHGDAGPGVADDVPSATSTADDVNQISVADDAPIVSDDAPDGLG